MPAMPPKPYSRLSEVQVLGPEYQKALRTPRPEIGWQGDPDLTLAYHHLTGWEVLREEAVQDPRTGRWESRHVVIARQRAAGDVRIDVNELIRGLVARDTQVANQSHRKATEAYIDAVAKEEKERADRAYEAIRPVHEKLAWQVAKEAGELSKIVSLAGTVKDAVD